MQNVVSLRSDRPRPQRALAVPRSGARILFFTGVRYCRDDRADGGIEDRDDDLAAERMGERAAERASGRALDATAH